MTFLNTIFDQVILAVTTLLISLGFVTMPVEPPPIETPEENPEVVETIPELPITELPEYNAFIAELEEIKTQAVEDMPAPIVITVELPPIPPVVEEEEEPEEEDEEESETGFETAGSIFDEQEEITMPEEETPILYDIEVQEGSPLSPRTGITLEEMRDYVLQTNYNVLTFREQMETATAQELIDWLEANGFQVTESWH